MVCTTVAAKRSSASLVTWGARLDPGGGADAGDIGQPWRRHKFYWWHPAADICWNSSELADEYTPATREWVTFDKPDARVLLAGERVTYAYSPTNRHLGNLIRNALPGASPLTT